MIWIPECHCNEAGVEEVEGAKDMSCDDNGKCNCLCNIKGPKCNECNAEFYDFPNCHGKTLIICKLISVSSYLPV